VFIGHFAVALAAKRAAPRASLPVLFAAVGLPDLMWPLFLLAGWERVRIEPGNTAFTPLAFDAYPISHSLVADVGWGALLGAIVWVATRDRAAAVAAGLGVVSHWILDVVTHRPDMPLYPGGPLVGLGLWNFVPATLVVELTMFASAIAIYVRATRARDRAGRYGFWGLIAVLVLSFIGAAFCVAPPDVRTLALTSLVGGVVTLVWAAWIERHREARETGSGKREP
jgi:membrane-bound metal-dependent hydrolase YbcI (DUF457 family)